MNEIYSLVIIGTLFAMTLLPFFLVLFDMIDENYNIRSFNYWGKEIDREIQRIIEEARTEPEIIPVYQHKDIRYLRK